MASHLRKPVSWIQERVGSREFLEWIVYLDEEERKTQRADWHAASIVQAVSRVLHKHPKRVKIEDCLVKFVKEQPLPTHDDLDGGERVYSDHQERKLELKQQMSKAFWGALVGVDVTQ